MAWLNINKEFSNFYYEKVNYEEELNQYFNWCTDPECPCEKQWDGDESKLTINPDTMACDDYPFRESIRKSAIYNLGLWSFRRHHYPKVKNKTVWKFSQMVINNYIGKSFDDAFSYYLKHTKGIPDRYNEFLDYNFVGNKPSYYIDDKGLIQECIYPRSKWQQEWYDNHKSTKLYTFKSADYRTETIHKHTGETLKEAGWKVQLTKRYNISHFVEVLVSGYFVENVQPNSRLEKRLKAEKRQKQKQIDKYWKLQRKNKQYSFLTREEEEIKKAKIQDDSVLLKHGFNEESFKGEPYHGRKNKKKNK